MLAVPVLPVGSWSRTHDVWWVRLVKRLLRLGSAQCIANAGRWSSSGSPTVASRHTAVQGQPSSDFLQPRRRECEQACRAAQCVLSGQITADSCCQTSRHKQRDQPLRPKAEPCKVWHASLLIASWPQ